MTMRKTVKAASSELDSVEDVVQVDFNDPDFRFLAGYVRITKADKVARSVEVRNGKNETPVAVLDYDENGDLMGIEVLSGESFRASRLRKRKAKPDA